MAPARRTRQAELALEPFGAEAWDLVASLQHRLFRRDWGFGGNAAGPPGAFCLPRFALLPEAP